MLMEAWHCLSLSVNNFFREPGLDMGLDMGLELAGTGGGGTGGGGTGGVGSRSFGAIRKVERGEGTTAVSDMAGTMAECE